MSDWANAISDLPLRVRANEKSILQHFEPASPHLDDRDAFLAVISERLRKHPAYFGRCGAENNRYTASSGWRSTICG